MRRTSSHWRRTWRGIVGFPSKRIGTATPIACGPIWPAWSVRRWSMRRRSFGAPFTQALLNLFVDVRQRGIDIYPDDGLATNPWQNFVLYEQSVMARLAMLGRSGLVQPDAGDDGTLANYQQFSLYEDFGQNDLFMPWSAAFPLLAGAPGADAALRFLLQHGLYGPLGLADAAHWKTGQTEPSRVTARHDFGTPRWPPWRCWNGSTASGG